MELVREKALANGKQLADVNAQLFAMWVAAKTDADFREMTVRGQLSRTEIAKECGFAKSALNQNPRIKSCLIELETELRARDVLPRPVAKTNSDPLEPKKRESQAAGIGRHDLERQRRLEQENAALRAEVSELRFVLEKQMVIKEALSMSGRIPR